MSSPGSQYLYRLRQAPLASMGTINAAVDWVLLVPIYSLLSSIEILYYITNLLYFPHNTFTQPTLRLCTSLLILSLSTSGGNLSKSTSNSYIPDTKAKSKNLIIILLSFVLLLCESSFMEDIKWASLAQEDREILILDFILESLWRFLILDFMAAGIVGKLLQTLLSARLVSIVIKNDWHIILRLRFLCGGVLIGLAFLGVEKLKDMRLSKAFGETVDEEQERSPQGKYSTKCMKKSSSLTVQSPQKISTFRTYTEASSEIDSSKDLKPLILTPKDSKINSNSNDSTLNLNPLKVKEENSVDTAGLARILNYLPEGVIVLDPKGQVKFMNRYMRNIFEFDEKITLQDLSQSLSDFKFREASIQVSHSLNVIRETSSNGQRNMPWRLSQESIPKLSRAEFLQRVQKISSLESLFFYCITDPETREIAQKYVPTFQTRYHQQSTNEWYSIEMKIHLLSENEKQFVILLRDITDRENKLITLEKEKILYRDNLIASFSHELRTPLNSNLAFLEQCMDSSQIPTQVKKDLVKPALDSGRLLLFMVSDILDYSLMILNKMRLDIKPFDINQTVRQCLDLFQIKAAHKKLKLSLIVEEGISPVIFSDHRRISQVLTNLLSNAVQFTTQGEIQVIISNSVDRNIKITVQDTGIGMEKHAQERLERTLSNEILKEKLSEASVGVGLGLFISNKMVKALSGDGEIGIQFKSEYDQGSKFFFEVENREPKECMSSKILRKAKQRDSVLSETDEKIDLTNRLKEYNSYTMKNTFRTPKKIVSEGCQVKALIVDDEIFNIIVIENFCKSMGIATEKAFNGREALNKLKMHSNDNAVSIKIVFMDINMPLMDGYESTVAILDMIEKGEIEDVIVIGVTAYVSRDMIEKGLECGMTEVLNKPVTKDSLVDVLKKYKFIK